MTAQKISLKLEDNPDYYDIIREHNELMANWDKLNIKILSFRIPTFIIKPKRLRGFEEELKNIEKQFIEWNKKACSFSHAPKYKFDVNENQELAFIHYTNNMRFLINTMEDSMVLINANYNRQYSRLEGQINFIIAIGSFVVAMVGLVISIFR